MNDYGKISHFEQLKNCNGKSYYNEQTVRKYKQTDTMKNVKRKLTFDFFLDRTETF